MKTTKLILLGLLLVLTQNFYAQTSDNRHALKVFVTKSEYKGDLGNDLWKFGEFSAKDNYAWNWGGALAYQNYINSSFDWGLQFGFGEYDFWNENTKLGFQGNKYDANLFVNYKLNNGYIFGENSVVAPYITFGIGGAGYTGGNVNKNPMFDFTVPVGAGFQVKVTENFGFEYKYVYNFTSQDMRDHTNVANLKNDFLGLSNDAYGQHFVGFSYTFGSRDTDKDGVKDSRDLCPNTPVGVVVDANGCPVDTDKDGVADYLDKCPDMPGLAKFNGCPDSDGDGVPDNMDKCPDTPANVQVDANGCPLDSDGDGIVDYLDKCPNQAGLAKFNGCPDTDGDGIPDSEDKCPEVAGTRANKGCPEVSAETNKIFKEALQGIQFDFDKATIKPQSYPILQKVVTVMNENPAYNLVINGHTDSKGSDAYNLDLSKRRAASVMQYLIDKGISASRLTSNGYGESRPVADNKTKKGQYLNRRVEFKVEF